MASASSSSTSTQEDFYKLLTMDQSKIEKSLNEREEDPVTDSGLVAFFDDYNYRGGRRPLREFLAHTWLRTLERVQGEPSLTAIQNYDIFWNPYLILLNLSTFG